MTVWKPASGEGEGACRGSTRWQHVAPWQPPFPLPGQTVTRAGTRGTVTVLAERCLGPPRGGDGERISPGCDPDEGEMDIMEMVDGSALYEATCAPPAIQNGGVPWSGYLVPGTRPNI